MDKAKLWIICIHFLISKRPSYISDAKGDLDSIL